MIYHSKYCSIVRNSKNIFYKFFLDSNKNLIIEEYTGKENTISLVFRHAVLDYSVDIDPLDKIHILYISLDGNLKYATYPSNSEEKILCNIKLKDFNIRFLTLKIIASNIHIFYMYGSKVNNLQWAIYHVQWHENKWNTKKLADVTTQKYLYPYMVDVYNGELYLFYSKDCNSIYSLKKFNINFNVWSNLNDVPIKGAHNTAFLITPNGKALLCYNSSINKIIQILIISADLNKETLSWSKETLLSNVNTNALYPSILTKNNFTYITWEEGNTVVYAKSNYDVEAWSKSNTLTIKHKNMFSGIYMSTHEADLKFKSTFVLADISLYPYPIINLEMHPTTNTFYTEKKMLPDNKANPIDNRNFFVDMQKSPSIVKEKFIPFNPNYLYELELKNKYISDLHLLVGDQNKKIVEFGKNDSTKKEVEALNEKIRNNETIVGNLNKKIQSNNDFIEELNKRINEYINVIDGLQKQLALNTESYTANAEEYKNRIDTLQKQLELRIEHHTADTEEYILEIEALKKEKENIMQIFNFTIQSLNKTLSDKDALIQTLQEKLSSSFWNKLLKQ